MLFRRIVFSALVVGAIAGALLGLGQHFTISQIIYAAEAYEGGAVPGEAVAMTEGAAAEEAVAHDQEDGQGGHSHSQEAEEAWGPADGAERIAYTVFSDVLAAIGFGALLLVAMYVARRGKGVTMGPAQGALWGLAGFAVLFGAPALGLPPEIPGAAAAPLEQRQLWWILTALVTASGLGLLAFAPGWKKLAGVVLLPIPHLFGAPHHEGPMFSHPVPSAVEALQALHTEFVLSTVVVNAAFWVVLGIACSWAMKRWVLREEADPANAGVHA